MKNTIEIFISFLWLGIRSFGGPVAHLGYFYDEFVVRRKWLTDREYSSLTALCQFLPGPASSQTGFGIGLKRGGTVGAYAAWLGFTLPSAVIMTAAAYGLGSLSAFGGSFIVKGLLILTASVVAHAVWSMGTKLCPDYPAKLTAFVSAAIISVFNIPFMQIVIIILAGTAGYYIYGSEKKEEGKLTTPAGFINSLVLIGFFFGLLLLLPIAAKLSDNHLLVLFELFYRAGALVFGGGHVVLPLLNAELVSTGLMPGEVFLSGYGIAQLVPGPLFTFASFAGTSVGGFWGGIVSLIGLFMSTFLLVPAVMPLWDALSAKSWASSAMKGINASVVGILGAALYNPIWVKAVYSSYDFAVFIFAFAMLILKKSPLWLTALFCLAASYFSKLFI